MFDERLQPVLAGGRYFEAPRWQGDRLWLVDALDRTLSVVSAEGTATVACRLEGVPAGLGFLPDGTPLVTDMHGGRWSAAPAARRAGTPICRR